LFLYGYDIIGKNSRNSNEIRDLCTKIIEEKTKEIRCNPLSEEDITDVEQMITLLRKSSDATLMLNLITPYLIGERKQKLSKVNQDLIEVIQMLVVNQMKMQNDMRAILLYLNKKEILDADDIDAPDLNDLDHYDPKSPTNNLYC